MEAETEDKQSNRSEISSSKGFCDDRIFRSVGLIFASPLRDFEFLISLIPNHTR